MEPAGNETGSRRRTRKSMSSRHGQNAQLGETWAQLLLPCSPHSGATDPILLPQHVRIQINDAENQYKRKKYDPDAPSKAQKLRFPPMAAPGPSGCRGEHLMELMSTKNRYAAEGIVISSSLTTTSYQQSTIPTPLRSRRLARGVREHCRRPARGALEVPISLRSKNHQDN